MKSKQIKLVIWWGVVVLLVLLVGYGRQYRTAEEGIYALALVQNKQQQYIPHHHWQCQADGACTVTQFPTPLTITFVFDPPHAPAGHCHATYGQEPIACTIRQNYYYLWGAGIRPYLLLTDSANQLPITHWRVENFIAPLALGHESAWLSMVVWLGIATAVILFPRLWRTFRPAQQGVGWQLWGGFCTLSTAVLIAIASSLGQVFLLFITGIMLD